jgi:hypothetical protein
MPTGSFPTAAVDWRKRAQLVGVDTQIRQLQSAETRWILHHQRTEAPKDDAALANVLAKGPPDEKPASSYYHATGRLKGPRK